MFSWIKRKVQAKFSAMQVSEMEAWTRNLKSMDSSSVAMIVAMTAHVRNCWQMEKGVDLLLPHLAIHQEPFLALQLGSAIKDLQKSGKETIASGLFPWLFTVRACFDLELLAGARELWRQLERGFSQVDSAAANIETMVGIHLDTDGATRFPVGFTPDPL